MSFHKHNSVTFISNFNYLVMNTCKALDDVNIAMFTSQTMCMLIV